ncbi:MAG: hypothetical protein JO061_11025 [Acidobacteriaceae bacterium]|nr:hypothetical protein [Acidobacteriaceae bacterium]
MLSSTSSSNSKRVLRLRDTRAVSVPILLAIIALSLIGFELFARVVIERNSKVQRMVNEEYQEAIHIRHATGAGPKQLLIVGNSLVGHGLDFDEVQRDMPAGWEAHRFWIYNTNYDDWYFGLRRVFARGGRPDAVAVVFAALNWYATGIRGDYSSQYLFEARDLSEVQSRLDLTSTTTSSLLFARFSKAFALRSEVRKVLLNALVPDLPEMYSLFKPGIAQPLTDRQVVAIVAPRIQAYRDIARQFGSSLIVIVPPIERPKEEHQAAMRAAAAEAGVPIFMPMSCADVAHSEFADDMHLDPAGAKRWTAAMMKQLGPALQH